MQLKELFQISENLSIKGYRWPKHISQSGTKQKKTASIIHKGWR